MTVLEPTESDCWSMCSVQMLSRSSAAFVETNQALVDVFDDRDARQILICATPFEKLRAAARSMSAVNKIGRGVGTRTTILIGPARACLGPVTKHMHDEWIQRRPGPRPDSWDCLTITTRPTGPNEHILPRPLGFSTWRSVCF